MIDCNPMIIVQSNSSRDQPSLLLLCQYLQLFFNTLNLSISNSKFVFKQSFVMIFYITNFQLFGYHIFTVLDLYLDGLETRYLSLYLVIFLINVDFGAPENLSACFIEGY